MKLRVVSLILVCLPLSKGHDFVLTGPNKQCFAVNAGKNSSGQHKPGISISSPTRLARDLSIDESKDADDDLECKAKELNKPALPQDKSILIGQVADDVNNMFRDRSFLFSSYIKYISEWALRV